LTCNKGGLSTSFASLWSNIGLSSLVALIGITLPIALSYTLLGLLDATPIQAFAAGAALCSTSLGTTFTILGTSGLDKSKLGVILSSAAMLDDVAGLVMVQVIANLGRHSAAAAAATSFSAVTVIRPVFVSIAFAIIVPAFCWAVLKPITIYMFSRATDARGAGDEVSRVWWWWVCTPIAAFGAHTLLLLALVTASTYAGTSNLFAAYIAGAAINWWDALVNTTLQQRRTVIVAKTDRKTRKTSTLQEPSTRGAAATVSSSINPTSRELAVDQHVPFVHKELTGAVIYEQLYAPAMTTILKPFFFVCTVLSCPDL
jgi:hypothetical protein